MVDACWFLVHCSCLRAHGSWVIATNEHGQSLVVAFSVALLSWPCNMKHYTPDTPHLPLLWFSFVSKPLPGKNTHKHTMVRFARTFKVVALAALQKQHAFHVGYSVATNIIQRTLMLLNLNFSKTLCEMCKHSLSTLCLGLGLQLCQPFLPSFPG